MNRFALVTSLDLLPIAVDDRPGWSKAYHDMHTSLYGGDDCLGLSLGCLEGRLQPDGICFFVHPEPLAEEQYAVLEHMSVTSLEITPDIEMPPEITPTGYRVGVDSLLIKGFINARRYLFALRGGILPIAYELNLLRRSRVYQAITVNLHNPPLIDHSCACDIRGVLCIDEEMSIAEFEEHTCAFRQRISPNISLSLHASYRWENLVGNVELLIVKSTE